MHFVYAPSPRVLKAESRACGFYRGLKFFFQKSKHRLIYTHLFAVIPKIWLSNTRYFMYAGYFTVYQEPYCPNLHQCIETVNLTANWIVINDFFCIMFCKQTFLYQSISADTIYLWYANIGRPMYRSCSSREFAKTESWLPQVLWFLFVLADPFCLSDPEERAIKNIFEVKLEFYWSSLSHIYQWPTILSK